MDLSKDDIDRISSAVKIAESKTSGEIATAIIKESSDYAFYELGFSVVVGAFYFLLITIFSDSVTNILSSMFWNYKESYLLLFTGFSLFFVIGVTYVLSNIPVIDRLIIPNKIMEKQVYNRAVRHFIESGTCYTKDRTGILIFISELEKKVVLLADKGINDKIPQERWDGIVAEIILGIKGNMLVDSISSAVIECGNILEKEFPIKKDDENELTDVIQVLEE